MKKVCEILTKDVAGEGVYQKMNILWTLPLRHDNEFFATICMFDRPEYPGLEIFYRLAIIKFVLSNKFKNERIAFLYNEDEI